MWLVEVDMDKCTGCEACINVCRAGVYVMAADRVEAANISECNGCESCIGVCPAEAITVTEI